MLECWIGKKSGFELGGAAEELASAAPASLLATDAHDKLRVPHTVWGLDSPWALQSVCTCIVG